ncbi:MAG: OsmC family protein [Thermoplasmataceae archaeon]
MLSVSFFYDPDAGFISNVDGKPDIVIKDPVVERKGQYSPTEYLLFALGGCSAADVILIIKKMKISPESFSVKVDAEREANDPKVVKYAKISYIFSGEVDPAKVERAINLSLTKYCSVSILMERGGTDVRYDLIINGKPLKENAVPSAVN